jgi:hypothetical protein
MGQSTYPRSGNPRAIASAGYRQASAKPAPGRERKLAEASETPNSWLVTAPAGLAGACRTQDRLCPIHRASAQTGDRAVALREQALRADSAPPVDDVPPLGSCSLTTLPEQLPMIPGGVVALLGPLGHLGPDYRAICPVSATMR